MADTNVQIVISAADRASGTLRNVGRELRGLDRLDGTMGRGGGLFGAAGVGQGGLFGRMGMLGLGAGAFGGVGAGLLGKEVISAASSYEDMLVNIQKKAGTTREETADLGQQALNLSTSGEIAASIDDIMGAMERGAAAGIPLDKLLDFTKVTAKAADAFDMSSEDVGNAAAGFAVGMGVGYDEMESYFGLINKLADSGIASESGIINFLDRAGVGMKQFGLSAEQAAAYGATLENIKMPSETAARMMNALTTRLLAPPTDKAAAGLKNIVGNMGKFNKQLAKDPGEALQFFLQKVRELDKFKRAELLTDFVGAEWQDEVSRLADVPDEIRRNLAITADRDSWVNSLGDAYALKLGTLSAQWQVFKNQLTTTAIDVGTMGLPLLKAALDEIKGLVQWIDEGIVDFGAGLDPSAFTGAQTAIQGAATALSELIHMPVTEGGPVTGFFTTLATEANNAADTIGRIAGYIQTVAEFLNDQNAQDEALKKVLPESMGGNPVGSDSKNVDDWMKAEDERMRRKKSWNPFDAYIGTLDQATGEAAKTGRKPLSDMLLGTTADAKSGRLKLPEPAGASADRFGAGGSSAFSDVGAVPTPAVAIDASSVQAFAAQVEQANQMKQRLGDPVTATADLNAAAFMAGLTAMETAALGTANRIKAIFSTIAAPSVGGGGGGGFESAKRGQFAPVSPGG